MVGIVQDEYGSCDVLELRDIEKPEIAEGEVLVRVRAAGVNPGDWAIMSGLPYIARRNARNSPDGPGEHP
jgi:NADPH:quinone reductase-like Zn-dependent oxidoreductase